jgi:hypothetical protein
MANDNCFCVASANLHSQTFEDEVVVLDTKSGVYFSLRGSAVDVWSLIESHVSRTTIVDFLTARYDSDPELIFGAVDSCIERLSAHGLIRETPSCRDSALFIAPSDAKLPFSEPLVEHFTDMQDLLLLDPIHDVSEEGWPHSGSHPA